MKMYKTFINEKYGGYSVDVSTKATLNTEWIVTSENLKRRYIMGISKSYIDDKFDALSYNYEGMDNVRTDGVLWLDDLNLVKMSTSCLENLVMLELDENEERFTLKEYLDKHPDEEIKVTLYCNVKYNEKIKNKKYFEDDIIIGEADDINDIELMYVLGSDYDYFFDYDEVIVRDNLPVIRADEEFDDFFQSVFDYYEIVQKEGYENYKSNLEEGEEDKYGSAREYEVTDFDVEWFCSGVCDRFKYEKS
jgi:hypothetical protein